MIRYFYFSFFFFGHLQAYQICFYEPGDSLVITKTIYIILRTYQKFLSDLKLWYMIYFSVSYKVINFCWRYSLLVQKKKTYNFTVQPKWIKSTFDESGNFFKSWNLVLNWVYMLR